MDDGEISDANGVIMLKLACLTSFNWRFYGEGDPSFPVEFRRLLPVTFVTVEFCLIKKDVLIVRAPPSSAFFSFNDIEFAQSSLPSMSLKHPA